MKKYKKVNHRAEREQRKKQDSDNRMYQYGAYDHIYKGTLTLLGEMSQLPDSQKLFGALVYALAEDQGAACASEFVRRVHGDDSRYSFSLSSVLPDNFFPMPKAYLLREAKKRGDESKTAYENIKRLDYVSLDTIKSLLESADPLRESSYAVEHIRLETGQQVHVNALNIDGEDNLIFSVQQTRCIRYDGTSKETVKTYSFWLRTTDKEIVAYLSRAIGHVFTLGRRSSQGYNLFEMTSFERQQKMPLYLETAYLSLGMLLPQQIDFHDKRTALSLFTSERRPYVRQGNLWNDTENRGHFISFLAPGSIVALPPAATANASAVNRAGRSVDAPVAQNGEIVFGNAFLYPLEVKQCK